MGSAGEKGEGFNYFDTASVMVEESGELYTINLCEDCCNLRQDKRNEPRVNGKQCTRPVVTKRPRGKLAVGLSAMGVKRRILEIYAGEKINATNLLNEIAAAMCLGKEWLNESPRKEELALLRREQEYAIGRRNNAKTTEARLTDDESKLIRNNKLNS